MFITFEGTEGSGKTTQVNLTMQYLRDKGHDVLLTREPGGTLVGDSIREILLNKDTVQLSPRAELLLFNASRAQLVDQVLRPHLEAGGVVLCDRYVDSSVAYQGYGHGLDVQDVIHAVNIATGGLMPDVTIFLDLTPEEGLKRRAESSLFGEEFNRIDAMSIAFHQRVYQGYTDIGRAEPKRWVRIDAAQSPEQVQRDIVAALEKRFKAHKKRKKA